MRQSSTCINEFWKTTKLSMNEDVYFKFALWMFLKWTNYQNTCEKFFKQVHAYMNFQKLLNYQWMRMCILNLLFDYFLKWTKIPKYLWKVHQTSTCIYELLKPTKLPKNDDTYFKFGFWCISKVSKTTKIKYLWNMRLWSRCIYEFSKTTKCEI